MRNFGLVAFCLVALSISTHALASDYGRPQNPQWVEFNVDASMIVYIDVGSIRRTYGTNSGGAHDVMTATAWFLMDLPMSKPDGSAINNNGEKITESHSEFSPKFSSVVNQIKFDCQNSLNATISTIEYRGNMGTGRVVDLSDNQTTRWVNDMQNSNKPWEELACIGFPYGYLKTK